jgi:hypothetical protein
MRRIASQASATLGESRDSQRKLALALLTVSGFGDSDLQSIELRLGLSGFQVPLDGSLALIQLF